MLQIPTNIHILKCANFTLKIRIYVFGLNILEFQAFLMSSFGQWRVFSCGIMFRSEDGYNAAVRFGKQDGAEISRLGPSRAFDFISYVHCRGRPPGTWA